MALNTTPWFSRRWRRRAYGIAKATGFTIACLIVVVVAAWAFGTILYQIFKPLSDGN